MTSASFRYLAAGLYLLAVLLTVVHSDILPTPVDPDSPFTVSCTVSDAGGAPAVPGMYDDTVSVVAVTRRVSGGGEEFLAAYHVTNATQEVYADPLPDGLDAGSFTMSGGRTASGSIVGNARQVSLTLVTSDLATYTCTFGYARHRRVVGEISYHTVAVSQAAFVEGEEPEYTPVVQPTADPLSIASVQDDKLTVACSVPAVGGLAALPDVYVTHVVISLAMLRSETDDVSKQFLAYYGGANKVKISDNLPQGVHESDFKMSGYRDSAGQRAGNALTMSITLALPANSTNLMVYHCVVQYRINIGDSRVLVEQSKLAYFAQDASTGRPVDLTVKSTVASTVTSTPQSTVASTVRSTAVTTPLKQGDTSTDDDTLTVAIGAVLVGVAVLACLAGLWWGLVKKKNANPEPAAAAAADAEAPLNTEPAADTNPPLDAGPAMEEPGEKDTEETKRKQTKPKQKQNKSEGKSKEPMSVLSAEMLGPFGNRNPKQSMGTVPDGLDEPLGNRNPKTSRVESISPDGGGMDEPLGNRNPKHSRAGSVNME